MLEYIKKIIRFYILKNRNKTVKFYTKEISLKANIGKYVVLNRGVELSEYASIDDFSYLNNNSILSYANVGKFVSISYNCIIGAGNHRIDYFSTSPHVYNINQDKKSCNKVNKAIIGNDVWIGANSVVMSGVKIGNGAIIGAGSIVTKDIPKYSIAVGNPAKVIKMRFNKETIELLEKVQYWNNYNEIKRYISMLKSKEEWLNYFKDKWRTNNEYL